MKYFVILSFSLAIVTQAIAIQPKLGLKCYSMPFKLMAKGGSISDRLQFGGNIGLQLGNPTTVLVSPSIGYVPSAEWFDDRLMYGLGITYIYSKATYSDYNYESNIFGGRVFSRVLVTENIFGYSELEFLNAPNYYIQDRSREWVTSFFVGGGYLMPFSDKGGVSITVLYNLAWTPNNIIYSSPWNIRFGVMF